MQIIKKYSENKILKPSGFFRLSKKLLINSSAMNLEVAKELITSFWSTNWVQNVFRKNAVLVGWVSQAQANLDKKWLKNAILF